MKDDRKSYGRLPDITNKNHKVKKQPRPTLDRENLTGIEDRADEEDKSPTAAHQHPYKRDMRQVITTAESKQSDFQTFHKSMEVPIFKMDSLRKNKQH